VSCHVGFFCVELQTGEQPFVSRSFARPGKECLISIRVLIADPDESLLAEYRGPLRRDFELVTVTNAWECIARLRQVVPDVLVLEPHLPRGGGHAVLAAMRDEPNLTHIPVMILTACRDLDILKSVAPFPIHDYYVKPLPPAHLKTRIRRLLDHRRRCADPLYESNRMRRWNSRRTQETVGDD